MNEIQGDLNNFAHSLAKDLGLQDFYSVHLMDYCYGSFTPGPVPNATLKKSKIDRNVTHCSNKTAMFSFDPTAALTKSLEDSGVPVTLAQLNWPDGIEKGIETLKTAFQTAFVLYCMGIGFTFITLLVSIFWISGISDGGKGTAAIEITVATLAWICLGIASAIATAVGVKGDNTIDKLGKPIGVSADRGNGFMGLTWAATALMIVCSIIGCAGCCMKRNRQKVRRYGGEKA